MRNGIHVVLVVIFVLLSSIISQADEPVYVRVKLNGISPSSQGGVAVAAMGFAPIHRTLGRLGFAFEQGLLDFGIKRHAKLDWSKFKKQDLLKPGQTSGWMEISKILNQPGREKALVFSFADPDRDFPLIGRQNDVGNLKSVDATIEFASKPQDSDILASVRYKTENSSAIPLIVVDSQDKPLSSYAKSIETLYDNTKRRVERLKAKGIKHGTIPKKILTSSSSLSGYFFDMYDDKAMRLEIEWSDLMRIRYAPANYRRERLLREMGRELELFVRTGLHDSQKAPVWSPISNETIKSVSQLFDWMKPQPKNCSRPRGVVYLRDEPALLKEQMDNPAAQKAFHAWLAKRGVSPESIGVKRLEDAEILYDLGKLDRSSESSRRLFYLSTWFRQEQTAKYYSKLKKATLKAAGGNIYCYAPAYHAGFFSTPDYFVWSRIGGSNHLLSHYGFGWGQPWWTPETMNLYIAQMHSSAVKFSDKISTWGALWYPSRIRNGIGTELSAVTAMNRGIRHFYFYGVGPSWTGWEWFSGTDDSRADAEYQSARLMGIVADLEDTLVNGKFPKPRAALLIGRGAELWADGATNPHDADYRNFSGILTERRMTQMALAMHQIPIDILPEEEYSRLNQYDVVYIVDPWISSDAQNALAKWVHKGGFLWLGGGAASRNEIDSDQNLFVQLVGKDGYPDSIKWGKIKNYGERDTKDMSALRRLGWMFWQEPVKTKNEAVFMLETFKDNIADVQSLAKDENGQPCALLAAVGKGKVLVVGTRLGAVMARTAKPKQHIGSSNRVSWQRWYDPRITKLYLLPETLDGRLKPELKISQPGFDANFFETPSKTVLLLADYYDRRKRKVDVSMKLQNKFKKAVTVNGEPIDMEFADGWTILHRVPVESSQFVILSP